MPTHAAHSRDEDDGETPTNVAENTLPPAVSSQRTLSQALYARKGEFTRQHSIKVKIGAWNVAGKKGTEYDVGQWFVKSKGLSESLHGLGIHDEYRVAEEADQPPTESVQQQEARSNPKEPTIPKNDPGGPPQGDQVQLYALGLQEVVDITSATEALRTDPATSKKWRQQVESCLPPDYCLVAEQQLIGLLLLIYASPEIAPQVTCVSSCSIGTGLLGYMGNKGATATRLVLGDTASLVFINSHLSSGTSKADLERRNWDAQQIVSRAKFDPIVDSFGIMSMHGRHIGDEDFAFWFGDLNYRLESIPGDDVRRLLMLHTRNEYDLKNQSRRKIEDDLARSDEPPTRGHRPHLSTHAHFSSDSPTISSTDSSPTVIRGEFDPDSPSNASDGSFTDDPVPPSLNPAHLQSTLDSLIPHDELRQQQRMRKMFHDGWKEGKITFLPTYKYDLGTVGVFDSGEKHRAPSWCDRILYRTRQDRAAFQQKLVDEAESKRRDEQIRAEGVDRAADDEDTLFNYDPDADGADDYDDETTVEDNVAETTAESLSEDIMKLEAYMSHQRVLSSDHKPIEAIFNLKYDAVDVNLKAKVHQEVARDLDRAENETRPVVTVLIEGAESLGAGGLGAESDGVDFGDVYFEQKVNAQLTVANTGGVTAMLGFVKHCVNFGSGISDSPEWLSTKFETGDPASDVGAHVASKEEHSANWASDLSTIYILDPGNTCTISLELSVPSISLLQRLNMGEMNLNDVLILRVKDGRDHFIPVKGRWLPSVFGRDLMELTRLPEQGARGLQSQEPGSDGLENANENGQKCSAPPQIFQLTSLIERLAERALAEAEITTSSPESETARPWLRDPGWPFSADSWMGNAEKRHEFRLAINEAMDHGEAPDSRLPRDVRHLDRLETISETLVLFLKSLKDGIITVNMWNAIEKGFFQKQKPLLPLQPEHRENILDILSLSPQHNVSFIMVTSTLGRIAQELTNYFHHVDPSSRVDSGPIGLFRRKTFERAAPGPRHQMIRQKFAEIFADVLVRLPPSVGHKAKTAATDQSRALVEVFIQEGYG